jgi:hypothetical protein
MCESFINNTGANHRPTKGTPKRCNMPFIPGKLFCNGCLDYRPDEQFKHHTSRSDGRAQKCNDCQKEINNDKKKYLKNVRYNVLNIHVYRALSPVVFF